MEFNDAHSKAVFQAFKDRLAPLMAEVAPDWLLHHMELRRLIDHNTFEERVEVRLVIKPLGSARFRDDVLTSELRKLK